MHVQVYQPAPGLRPFFKSYYTIMGQVGAPVAAPILPCTYSVMQFSFATPIRFDGPTAVEHQAVAQKYAAAYTNWRQLKEPRETDLAALNLTDFDPTTALVAAKLPAATNKITVYYS